MKDQPRSRKPLVFLAKAAVLAVLLTAVGALTSFAQASLSSTNRSAAPEPSTPIKYVIVIFQENESFDHYFGTYPYAKNPEGEPPFYAALGTPTVNGLTAALLTNNPNSANPLRLDRSEAHTKDFDHGYVSEQKSFDGGLMDKFVENDGHGDAEVLDYYDGNTVTAFWYYAQHFAMNDNFFGSNLGPSTPGAINVISGNDNGAAAYTANKAQNGQRIQPGDSAFPKKAISDSGTLYGDIDPYYDAASKGVTASMAGTNIGDLLNAKGLTWGCFFGGYDDPTAKHANIAGEQVTDYIPHHEPFQYYGATSNVTHEKPSSVAMIGHSDQANHQYDIADFWAAAEAGNLPNYSFLKAPAYQDGHPEYSDPLDEQTWLVQTINKLETLSSWKNTAIFVTYDDSDGWYDHVMPPIVNQSNDPNLDVLEGNSAGTKSPLDSQEDRLGYGPRFPMILVSPYAKHNAVINTIADQSSVVRFVEDNWSLGRIGNGSFDVEAGSLNDMFDFSPGYYNPPVFLDPASGEPVAQITPFKRDGQLYMAVRDFVQCLDVQPHQNGDSTWFMYGVHLVEIPSHGDSASIDRQRVKLGSPILTHGGAVCLPIANLSKALGVEVVEYASNTILLKPNGTNDTTMQSIGENRNPSANAVTKFVLANGDTAKSSGLTVSAPTLERSPAILGTLVNQTINGTESGKTYNLTITATDAEGKPADGGSTIYVTFSRGAIDQTGILAYDGQSIGAVPVAVILDTAGKAVLSYSVGSAPTNWDAYDNDEITISDSKNISATAYTNEISVYNNVFHNNFTVTSK